MIFTIALFVLSIAFTSYCYRRNWSMIVENREAIKIVNSHYAKLLGEVKVALQNHRDHISAIETGITEAAAESLGAIVVEEEPSDV